MEHSGLSSVEAHQLLKKNGQNAIPEKKHSFLITFSKWFISPISLMLLAAAGLSFFIHKTFDGYFILFLALINFLIGYWQEHKADTAIKKLNTKLTNQVKVLRDTTWKQVASTELVPGDVIEVASGEVIPADGKILLAKNVSINESSLTGESLPKEKASGDTVFSGSYLVSGLAQIKITATGQKTYFGKTLFSIQRSEKKSLLEQDIIKISQFLSILSVLAIILLTTTLLFQHASFIEVVTLDLSLLIAGIPISLPTVMSLIIELGVVELAKKHVIVRRLSALEDLANVNFLLTDKTGTLTQNKIFIQKIIPHSNFSERDVIEYAYLSAVNDSHNTINQTIIDQANSLHVSDTQIKIIDFIPIDRKRKRTFAIAKVDNQIIAVAVGAPQEISKLCVLAKTKKQQFEKEVALLAEKGYRSIAIAVNTKTPTEKQMQLVGMIGISDALRPDARGVIDFLKQNHIHVAMVTGDNHAISHEIAEKLHLDNAQVMTRTQVMQHGIDNLDRRIFEQTAAFAEMLPDDKYQLVHKAKEYFVVAANGDGVNDIPAVKEANVGFAVKSAVDSLKATADIVLLSDGIGVIKDAIIEAQKIFARVYSYSVYRISESLRLIITITILGIIIKTYPLTPLQLILLAVLNDIPIISLAYDRVKIIARPAKIDVRQRFTISSLYGMAGVAESLILYVIVANLAHLPLREIQTIYFLKLTVSGHMLIYVARTKLPWFSYLPSKPVILATLTTQMIATGIAVTGILMPAAVPIIWIVVVWIWALLWMQLCELIKELVNKG